MLDGRARRTRMCGGCVGSGSPTPGPTLSCQSNFVVTDIMRMSISTFAPYVSDVCMKTSILRDSAAHTDVMRRAKIARRPAQVNHSRPIAAWDAETTIGFGRRGPRDGYRSRGSHELSIQEALFRGSTRRPGACGLTWAQSDACSALFHTGLSRRHRPTHRDKPGV